MKTVWLINVDRYGDETRAKGGRVSSVVHIGERIIEEYRDKVDKPEIVVVAIGLGMALSDYLVDKKIPHKTIRGLIHRLDGADIIVSKMKGGKR